MSVASESDQAVYDSLISWITGLAPLKSKRVWFLESEDHVDRILREFVSGMDSLIAPQGRILDSTALANGFPSVRIISYTGDSAEPMGEMAFDQEVFLNRLDYLTASYHPVTGLTDVRIQNVDDYSMFLSDADLALNEGVFPDHLLHPSNILGDRLALSAEPWEESTVGRILHVDKEGNVRHGLSGQSFSNIGEGNHLLESKLLDKIGSENEGLARCVSSAIIAEATSVRDWIPRYLKSLDVLRVLRRHDYPNLKISGFGSRMTSIGGGAMEKATQPYILWNDESALICTASTGRWFEVSFDVARVIEIIGLAPQDETIYEMISKEIGISIDRAHSVHKTVLNKIPTLCPERNSDGEAWRE